MNILPKNAPHSYAHARPWDKFKGKSVGRKEASAREVFRPGHKANPVLDEGIQSSSSAYGAGLGGPPRASAVEVSRRNFGSHASTDRPTDSRADVLGPVDLARERNMQAQPLIARKSKLDDPPPDTLRWQGPSEGLSSVAIRRKAHGIVDAQQQDLTQPPQRPMQQPGGMDPKERVMAVRSRNKDNAEVPFDNLRMGDRARPFEAVKHEERMRMREMIAVEKSMAPQAPAPPIDSIKGIAGLGGGALSKEQRAAALMDPRVQSALNAPNKVAFDQIKARNTTRLSAERKY